MAKKVEISKELQDALLVCVTEEEKTDQFIRERSIRTWKKAEEYWRLNQFIYWDEVALDYRDITHVPRKEDEENEDLAPKTFPIYRSYGESLVAAMTAAIPSVLFFPDDTNNPDDLAAANSYSRISELIQKHNKAPLIAIKSITTLFNQGLIASHVYYDKDRKYGTRQVPKYKNEKLQFRQLNCPQCGAHLANSKVNDINQDTDEEANDTNEQDEHDYLKDYTCDTCGYHGQPELGDLFDEIFPRLDGYTEEPKGRVCIDIWGPLNVRISSYAKTQSDVGLLELQQEMDIAAARDEFEDIADNIQASADFYSYERWGRTSAELLSNTMFNQTTVRYCWLRPWTFQHAKDKNTTKALKEKFPHGCCAIFVNDVFAEAYDESMDDCWTLSENPLDSWLHAIPMGRAMMDSQDAFNESENLNLQKQAYGITETFVGTDLINEDAYRDQQSGPGYVTFVESTPGEPISNQVHQLKVASLDEEEIQFGEHYNNLSQFLIGAVPSIWGGNQETGSKTATEYTSSRSYALQRLNNPWTVFKYFFAGTIGKACRLYVQNMTEDEKFTRKKGTTRETVWIKKAELTGKIGDVEPEVNEQFPITWAQKRDLLVQLIQMQNPVIGEIMLHPNNAQNVKDALGYPEYYIPGEKDRNKQLYEIQQMSGVTADEVPPDSNVSTIQPDKDVDDDNVHIMVCKYYLVSEEGMFLKETNPAAYMNIVLHMREHMQNLMPPKIQKAPVKNNVRPMPNNPKQMGSV